MKHDRNTDDQTMIAEIPKKPVQAQSSPSVETLFEVAKLLTGSVDPVAVMPEVFGALSSMMGLRYGSLSMISEPGSQWGGEKLVNPFFLCATAHGTAPDLKSRLELPTRVVQMVFRTGVPLVSLDVVSELGFDALPKVARDKKLALIAVPVRADADQPLVTGVLTVFRPFLDDPGRNVDTDLRVITMIASLFEQAMRVQRIVAQDRERLFREAGDAIKALQHTREEPEQPALPVEGIVGASPALSSVIRRVRKVAPTSAQVLLRGESGTGKELFARAIHGLSERADKPFIKVNCAALSETLLETELFGHEKGSFTGATGQKKGRFELAHGGTLFLDEIGEINHEFQTKLLRVLQEGEFERVGGTKTLKVDVRLITATNKDLEQAVAKGDFRADLYFRICVVPIQLPPLRERPEDIPDLAKTFLDQFNKENGTKIGITSTAMESLSGCRFPGNVRELENCINRTAALCEGDVIQHEDLACHYDACLSTELWRMQTPPGSAVSNLAAGEVVYGTMKESQRPFSPAAPINPQPPQRRKTTNTEAEELVEAMQQAGWVQAKAARILGMTPRQIGYALKKHNIEIKKI
ncbi:MAG: nif-specific transcriptional activator NifA [Pseudomonadota bacterium]